MEDHIIELNPGERSVLVSVLKEINLEQSFQIRNLKEQLNSNESLKD
jgi:hypothetical protein